jgi:hypothetical protein
MKPLLALIISLFVLFPFGQLTRLPSVIRGIELIKTPEINVYLIDLVIAGIGGYWLVWRLAKKRKLTPPPLAKPILLFLIFAFLSLIFNSPLLSSREVAVAGLYLIRWLAYAGLYFVILDLVSSPAGEKLNLKKLITNILIGAGTASAVLGLFQYFLLPNTKFLKYLHWDPHYYRAIGTFLDPAFLGMILVLTLILLVSTRWQEFSKKNSLFIINCSLFAVIYIALALTHSRSSYLAHLIGMSVIAWVKKAPRFFLIILLLGGLTLLILPRPAGEGGQLGRVYTIEARIKNWQQSAIIARDNPLFGVGFNAYRYAQRDYGFLKEDWQVSHAGAGADSSLLFILATTGILGAGAFLWLWWQIFKIGNLTVKASVLALITHSFFNNSLFYAWIMIWFWTLLAVSFPASQE